MLLKQPITEKTLGIDPGLRYSGFGVLSTKKGKSSLINQGFLTLSPKKSIAERVHLFYDFFNSMIKQEKITVIALETPFLGKNAQNFLKLGYLRGIVYLLSCQHTISLYEFTPCEIKQSITGYGTASKDQVARVIIRLFPRIDLPKRDDVTDAIAVSLCCLWQKTKISSS